MPFGIPSEDFHGGFGLPLNDYIEQVKQNSAEIGSKMMTGKTIDERLQELLEDNQ